jgi:hypothetical protein
MAAATKLLAKSGVCVAVLNYDDVTLLATGVTIANISGVETIVFFLILNGTTSSRTIGIGQTAVISFPSSVQCATGTAEDGSPSFVVPGLTDYGIGSG